MKSIIYLMAAACLVCMSACRKDSITNLPVASLTVVNVVTGGLSVKLGSYATSITNNNFTQFVLNEGGNDLYAWPVGDSAHPYFTYPKLNVAAQEMYSLFLGGMPSAVDGIIIKEDLPFYGDSVCGVRILNLSPNSAALNITLSTSPTVNEISNLAYKQYTDFKTYAGKASNTSYTFQVRKASDNSLLTSYTLNTPRFANVTLVIRGLVDGSPAIGITRVNQDR